MTSTVAVTGMGTMGAGIAQVAAQAGWRVRVFDAAPGAAQKGKDGIGKQLQGRVDKGRMEAVERDAVLGRIEVSPTFEGSLREADLWIEVVLEDLKVKRELFAKADKAAPEGAILASNTSSLSLTAIAAATARPERVVGMHFFNPAPVMKLLEVVRADQTSDETLERALKIGGEWGKETAVARDTPGFIVNRVARSFYGESLRMVGENLADHETVDRIMKSVGGFRMGPFELMDLVGVEVNFAVTQAVCDAYFGEPRFRPHPIQRKMVEAGLHGRKTGRGFYKYES